MVENIIKTIVNGMATELVFRARSAYGSIVRDSDRYDFDSMSAIKIMKKAEEAFDKWVKTSNAPTQSIGAFFDVTDAAREVYINLVGSTWVASEVCYRGKWYSGGFSAIRMEIPTMDVKEEAFIIDYFDNDDLMAFDDLSDYLEHRRTIRPRTLIMFAKNGVAHWAVELLTSDTPIRKMSLEEFTELLRNRSDNSDVKTAIKDLRKVLKQRSFMKLLKKGDE